MDLNYIRLVQYYFYAAQEWQTARSLDLSLQFLLFICPCPIGTQDQGWTWSSVLMTPRSQLGFLQLLRMISGKTHGLYISAESNLHQTRWRWIVQSTRIEITDQRRIRRHHPRTRSSSLSYLQFKFRILNIYARKPFLQSNDNLPITQAQPLFLWI